MVYKVTFKLSGWFSLLLLYAVNSNNVSNLFHNVLILSEYILKSHTVEKQLKCQQELIMSCFKAHVKVKYVLLVILKIYLQEYLLYWNIDTALVLGDIGLSVLYVIGQTWCHGANGDTQANIMWEFEYELGCSILFIWPSQKEWIAVIKLQHMIDICGTYKSKWVGGRKNLLFLKLLWIWLFIIWADTWY